MTLVLEVNPFTETVGISTHWFTAVSCSTVPLPVLIPVRA